MFNLFRKRKEAIPLFESLGTDIHCHLIPGVDDGSKNYEESIECIRRMYELGYRKMYITPHFQYPRYPNVEEDIKCRYEDLKKKVKESGVGMELIGVGGEYRIDDGFKKRVENPCFLKISDKYVLVELSLHQPRLGIAEVIFELQTKGYEVILAHPERYPYLGSTSQELERLKDQDVYFQINVLSLSGFYGEMARKTGYDLIDRGWVEFLGTDMHNMKYAEALTDASHDKKIRKLLDKCEFMNCKL